MVKMNTLTVLLVGGFAESAVVAAVGLSLVGLDYNWGTILSVGALQAVFICVARALPFQVGIHTYLLMVTMMLLLHYLLRIRPLVALIASLTGMCILALIETAVIPLYARYFTVILPEIMARPLLRLGVTILDTAIMGIILGLVRKTGFAFIRAGRKANEF